MSQNDDLISRQAVIDAIEPLLEQSEDDEHDKTWNNAIRGSINAVKHHVPSAQPQRTGRWIPCDLEMNARGMTSEYVCSNCGRNVRQPLPTRVCDYSFCPHCGARMEGES